MIQIRNVPEKLHRRLKARAAMVGLSLSDYLLNEIRILASRPSMSDPEIKVARLEFNALWITALRTPTTQNRTLLADRIDNMRENRQLDSNTAAYAFGSIGEPERAVEILLWLASVGGHVDQGPLWLPGMKSVRTNERFVELTDVLGLTQYWQDVAWPDQCGPTEAGGVQCFR